MILWNHPGVDVTGMVGRCEKVAGSCEQVLETCLKTVTLIQHYNFVRNIVAAE